LQAIASAWSRWEATRYHVFQRRQSLATTHGLALCLGMACATGVLAQMRVPLAFTPVPVTGQVFAVLLAGALLGKHYGGLSQLFYVGLGAAGVRWFAAAGSGLPFGPTGGYLIGFVPAAILVGWLTDGSARLRTFPGQVLLMVAGVAIIYSCGAIQFAVVMRTGLRATLTGAVLPFIGLDVAKAAAAAAVASLLLPKAAREDDVRRGIRDEGRP